MSISIHPGSSSRSETTNCCTPFHELDDELWLCWETKADFKCALKQFSVVDLKIIKQKSLCRWSRVLNYETNYKPFVLTPSCICIIIPLSCSLLSCPSQTNSLFMDPFFFVRECKHHELIPNIDFTELMRSQYQTQNVYFGGSFRITVVAPTCLTGLLFLWNWKKSAFSNKIISTGGNFPKTPY